MRDPEVQDMVQFPLRATDRQLLASYFGRALIRDPQLLASSVAELAFQEWIAWLSGSDRPLTITEQNTRRVLALYSTMYPNDIPNAESLYNNFRLPLGQARYIAQAISYQRGSHMHGLALENVLRAIHEAVAKWLARPEAEQAAQTRLIVKFPQSCDKVYVEAIGPLVLDNNVRRPQKEDLQFGYVQYPIETVEWKLVASALLRRLEGISQERSERIVVECETLREVQRDG